MLDEPRDTGEGLCHKSGFWDLVESFVQDRVYIGRMEPSVRFGGWGGGGPRPINLTYPWGMILLAHVG